jgi:hypothetical protein
MDQPRDELFGSSDAVIDHLKQRVDDIDGITLFLAPQIGICDPSGVQQRVMNAAGGQLSFCNGEKAVIHHETMEQLINDGILHRMGIKIRLKPLRQ